MDFLIKHCFNFTKNKYSDRKIRMGRCSYIKHGLIATCVGDSGVSSYKKSRQGNAEIDRTVIDVLKNSGDEYKIIDFIDVLSVKTGSHLKTGF